MKRLGHHFKHLYMYMYLRLLGVCSSVSPLPDVVGAASPLTPSGPASSGPVDPACVTKHHRATRHVTWLHAVVLSYHITLEAERWSEQVQGHDHLNKEQPDPGRGYRGWVATERHLNGTSSRSRGVANSRGDRDGAATASVS